MKKNKKKQNNKGFTLVELIIVMAIMAILVGAIAPQVFAYVEESRKAKDTQLVNTVFTAVQTGLAARETQTDIDDTLDKVLDSKMTALLGTGLDSGTEIIAKTESRDIVKSGTGAWNIFVNYTASSGHLEVYIASAKGAAGGIRVSN